MDEKILCMDTKTGIFFYTTAEDIRRVIKEVNESISKVNKESIKLNDLLQLLEIPRAMIGDFVGWNYPDYLINARIIPSGVNVSGKEIHKVEFIPEPKFL